jgi:hypothetical protein
MAFLDPKRRDLNDIDDLEPVADSLLSEKFNSALDGAPVQDDLTSDSEEGSEDHNFFCSTADHPIVYSIIQVLVHLFDFSEQHAWLRDNAALSVLHQFLGKKSSVESSVIQLVKSFVSDDFLIRFFLKYKEYVVKPSLLDGSITASISTSRIDTKVKVLAFYSGSFVLSAAQARILGNEASHHGHVRLVEILQSEELNKQFLFTLLDSSLELIKKFITAG